MWTTHLHTKDKTRRRSPSPSPGPPPSTHSVLAALLQRACLAHACTQSPNLSAVCLIHNTFYASYTEGVCVSRPRRPRMHTIPKSLRRLSHACPAHAHNPEISPPSVSSTINTPPHIQKGEPTLCNHNEQLYPSYNSSSIILQFPPRPGRRIAAFCPCSSALREVQVVHSLTPWRP